MTEDKQIRRAGLVALLVAGLAACAPGVQVTRTQPLAAAANAPYHKVLAIALYESFDTRRYMETELVNALAARGTAAVASTRMMDSRTPLNRDTVAAMVRETGADAVLVTQLVSLESTAKVKNMRPEASVNIRPTYFYDVFTVEVTEYMEPPSIESEHSLALATRLYDASSRDIVWAIQSQSKYRRDTEQVRDYSVFVTEAEAIVASMARDGVVSGQ